MEDLDLIEKVLKGNIEAFEKLIYKYELLIFKFIFNIVGDKGAAEDLTQEVFIAVYNKLYTFKKQYKFSTWMYKIAKNKAIDYMRSKENYTKINVDDIEFLLDNKELPEEIVEYRELKRSIEQFIENLDEKNRQILLLRYTNNKLTFDDIAEIVGLSKSAVKKRYYSIYDRYQRFMEEKYSLRGERDYGM